MLRLSQRLGVGTAANPLQKLLRKRPHRNGFGKRPDPSSPSSLRNFMKQIMNKMCLTWPSVRFFFWEQKERIRSLPLPAGPGGLVRHSVVAWFHGASGLVRVWGAVGCLIPIGFQDHEGMPTSGTQICKMIATARP